MTSLAFLCQGKRGLEKGIPVAILPIADIFQILIPFSGEKTTYRTDHRSQKLQKMLPMDHMVPVG